MSEDADNLRVIFFSFLNLFLFCLVRVAVLLSPLPVPNNFIMLLIGIIGGYLDRYVVELNYVSLLRVALKSSVTLIDIIFPVIMFEATYFTSLEPFVITGAWISLFLPIAFGFSVMVIAAAATLLFDYGWTWVHGVILGSIIVVPGLVLTRSFLKRLRMVIEVCVAPLWGLLVAKIVSFWLSKTVKDPVNEICITIASVYTCYLLALKFRVSGVIAVVTLGVSLSGNRSNMGVDTEKILLRSLHVVSSYFSCNLIVVYGMAVVYYVVPVIEGKDLWNILLVFLINNIVRVLVVLALRPFSKYNGQLLSWNNTLVICLCNIRGTVTAVLGLCLLHEDFGIVHKEKMFFQVLAQVGLSLFFNSVATNAVIRYDVLADHDEAKSRVISGAQMYLKEIRTNTISVFKHHNRFIADADWSVVEKFTSISHPLLRNNSTKERSCQRGDVQHLNQMETAAVNRILMLMKCSYWKQYEDGLVSRDALKRLLHWSDHALARGSSLILPSRIASAMKVSRFNNFWKHELWVNMGYWNYLSVKSKRLQHWVSAPLILLHFADTVLSVKAVMEVLFVPSEYSQIVLWYYNVTLVSCYAVILVLRVLVRRKMNCWDVLLLLLVVIGMFDIFFMWIVTSGSVIIKLIHLVFILARFLRIFRMAEVSPFFLRILIEVLEMQMSKRLSEGYDIGRSYIRGQLEVLRKINVVGKDFPEDVLAKFKLACERHKLETIKMLGCLQLEHPTVSACVKTKQATRIVLKSQLNLIKTLQKSRTISHQDGAKIEKIIEKKMAEVMNCVLKVRLPSIDQIVAAVPWIKESSDVYHLFKDKGRLIYFSYGDLIVSQLCLPGGIFIILDGMAVSKRKVLHSKRESVEVIDYMVSGNVIGEFSFLTGKPKHETISCETDMCAIFMAEKDLSAHIGGKPSASNEKLSEVEERMWKVVAMKLALRYLLRKSAWLVLSQSEILMKLMDATLVDGKAESQSMHQYLLLTDLLLIHGKLLDHTVNNVVNGPAYISRGSKPFTVVDADVVRPIFLVLPPESELDEMNVELNRFLHSEDDTEILCDSHSDITFSSGGSSNNPLIGMPRYSKKAASAVELWKSDFGDPHEDDSRGKGRKGIRMSPY
ncbi:sodium/hydrogen exchanger 10 isoform X2 [Aplysia californica]|uniref:Sodium/hydrogen exchanger 10 isoform X2 n=1 Tax=Aplysia californica TaxID=6500 RepID=A0ABM0JCA8_APLCA|nr:sodium/hydrogen exchanger 10 isoform X2 [Aplysia californica]